MRSPPSLLVNVDIFLSVQEDRREKPTATPTQKETKQTFDLQRTGTGFCLRGQRRTTEKSTDGNQECEQKAFLHCSTLASAGLKSLFCELGGLQLQCDPHLQCSVSDSLRRRALSTTKPPERPQVLQLSAAHRTNPDGTSCSPIIPTSKSLFLIDYEKHFMSSVQQETTSRSSRDELI